MTIYYHERSKEYVEILVIIIIIWDQVSSKTNDLPMLFNNLRNLDYTREMSVKAI